MNLFETPEEDLRRLLAEADCILQTPLGAVLEEEVLSPLTTAFAAIMPDDFQNIDTVSQSFEATLTQLPPLINDHESV